MSDKDKGMSDRELARQRLRIIMQVQSGTLTATEAAKALGISRKTYYEWENKALDSMLDALTNRPPGRPPKQIDPEKEQMQAEIDQLKKEIEEFPMLMDIRERMIRVGLRPTGPMKTSMSEARKKKNRKKKKRK